MKGSVIGLLRRPTVLLARELCIFAWFPRPAGVNRLSANAAVRLQAQASAPFEVSGVWITAHRTGFGLWWWDANVVFDLLERLGETDAVVMPESLAYPALSNGERILELPSGYEGQVWRNGALEGSVWSDTVLDERGWRAFARVQRSPVPADVPDVVRLTPVPPVRLLPNSVETLTLGSLAPLAATAAAAACLVTAAFFTGQAQRLEDLSRALRPEVAALRASVGPQTPAADRVALTRVGAFNNRMDEPDPVAGYALVLATLRRYDVVPTRFRTSTTECELELPYSALDSVDEIAVDLTASGAFTEVQPEVTPDAKTIRISMRPTGAAAAITSAE